MEMEFQKKKKEEQVETLDPLDLAEYQMDQMTQSQLRLFEQNSTCSIFHGQESFRSQWDSTVCSDAY